MKGLYLVVNLRVIFFFFKGRVFICLNLVEKVWKFKCRRTTSLNLSSDCLMDRISVHFNTHLLQPLLCSRKESLLSGLKVSAFSFLRKILSFFFFPFECGFYCILHCECRINSKYISLSKRSVSNNWNSRLCCAVLKNQSVFLLLCWS